MWRYDESTGKLVNINLGPEDEESGGGPGGLLVKRATQETDDDNDYSTPSAQTAYKKLTDASSGDYIEVNPYDPGVGLPGALWAESSAGGGGGHGLGRLGLHGHSNGGASDDGVLWRDVCELAEDPDQPYDDRLQAFAQAGFKLAAGIPFDVSTKLDDMSR